MEHTFEQLTISKNGTQCRLLCYFPEMYWEDPGIPQELTKLDWYSKHLVQPVHIKMWLKFVIPNLNAVMEYP